MAIRATGVNDFTERTFKTYDFTGTWAEHLGQPEQNFKMQVFGHPKNGKTEYAMQFAKYFTAFGKVDYFSFEQGISKSLQDAIKRNTMSDVAGKVMFFGKCTLKDMKGRLKSGGARLIIIDSRDYMKLTVDQWQELTTQFPRKAFLLICWEKGGKPAGDHAKAITYQVDIITHVTNYKANPQSRFGGNQPHTIWDKKQPAGTQQSLF